MPGMEAKRPPPCRALILSRGPDTEPAVLHFAGHRMIDAHDEAILRACFHGTGEGLWHWEGDLVTTTFDTPYGRDHDIEAQGEFRPLSREEFQAWACNPTEEPPWWPEHQYPSGYWADPDGLWGPKGKVAFVKDDETVEFPRTLTMLDADAVTVWFATLGRNGFGR